jgi:hypothetical protein
VANLESSKKRLQINSNILVFLVLLSQPHFEASVRMKLTLPKVGTWSPPGLSKLQSSIAGVKNTLA